ncbi:MAG: MMPL family transporter, partial [Lentisphaeria bacterium]|nr:MMPL family transporter [Lentisphaeria bacterium]
PMAMLILFLLMYFFFKRISLILAPLLLAIITVIWTMGLLIGLGYDVHIMSSMIPIFIMPIAVLNAIHIISMFFDRYQQTRDRVKTMESVMDSLFMAMLYTSLTTAAGFASLALTPIPPVQIFGFYAAFGIMISWVLTVTFIPAFIVMIPDRKLQNFGSSHHEDAPQGTLAKALHAVSGFAYRKAWGIVIVVVIILGVATYGITRIRINDNPMRWFSASHPIRVGDRVLNSHFGGTYMAYLVFEPDESENRSGSLPAGFAERLQTRVRKLSRPDSEIAQAAIVFRKLAEEAPQAKGADPLDALRTRVEELADSASDEQLDAWDEALLFVEQEMQRKEVFKNPDVLRYIARLQETLGASEIVGKSNSLADVVSTVHRELFEGKAEYLRIPDTQAAVAQCLITFQNSHRPQDLWHFVQPDYRRTSLWLQLRSGDNQDMATVIDLVDSFVRENPLPASLKYQWFGQTYINVVWQEKMVRGLLNALLGSFLVVFLMMTILFRSALWGLLSMLPLTVTIAITYGAVGLAGKDYDMPVAVLSSLSLGLAVDFAIHFLEHARVLREKHGTWQAAVGAVFGEPARAIWRNVIVIAVGFLPLLFAPLIPYKTVGVLMATILVVAGFTTLLILPALMRLLEPLLFPESKTCCLACNCTTCIVSAAVAVLLIVISVYQYMSVGWTTLTWGSAAAVLALAILCRWSSKREKCQQETV